MKIGDLGSVDSFQSFGRELVAGPPDLPSLLQRLSTQIQKVAPGAPIQIFLHQPSLERFTLHRMGESGTKGGPEVGFDRDSVLVQWLVAAEGPLYLVEDGSGPSSPELPSEERHTLASLGPVLFLPLAGRRRSHGAPEPLRGWVALGPRASGKAYDADELDFLANLVDLTALALEVLQLDGRLQAAEHETAEFMDLVAHELKQPMTSIQGYAKMLLMGIGGELDETQQGFVEVISSNAARMGKLVNDLLEISRLEAGRIQLRVAPVSMAEIVNEALEPLRAEIAARRLTLVVDVPADLPPAKGDRARLIQALGYLARNACQYTPDGGTIRIAASRDGLPGAPPDHLLMSINDTGIGMSPGELSKLKQKFFRADHELVRAQPGSGLGVSIARHLVALHGGELTIESEPGQGSTFHFALPLAEM